MAAQSSTAQEFITNVYFSGNPRKGIPPKPHHVDAETFLRNMEERGFKCNWHSDSPNDPGLSKKHVQHVAAFLTDDASTWFYYTIPGTFGSKYGKNNADLTWKEFKEFFARKFRVAIKEYDCHAELSHLHKQSPSDSAEQFAEKVMKVYGQMFQTLPANPAAPVASLLPILAPLFEDATAAQKTAMAQFRQDAWAEGIQYDRDIIRKVFIRRQITYGVTSAELHKQLLKIRKEEMTMQDFMDKLQDLIMDLEETSRRNGRAHQDAPRNGNGNGNGNNNGNNRKQQVHEVQTQGQQSASLPASFDNMSETDINSHIEALRAAKKKNFPRSNAGNQTQRGNSRGRGRGSYNNANNRGSGQRKERDPNARCDYCDTVGSHWTKDCYFKNAQASTVVDREQPKPRQPQIPEAPRNAAALQHSLAAAAASHDVHLNY